MTPRPTPNTYRVGENCTVVMLRDALSAIVDSGRGDDLILLSNLHRGELDFGPTFTDRYAEVAWCDGFGTARGGWELPYAD